MQNSQHEAIWILHPKQKAHGDLELVQHPSPEDATKFWLIDLDDNVLAEGKYILDAVGDEIAQTLFRSLSFLLPEDENGINSGKMMLRVCGRTYRQGPCHSTAYIPESSLAYERQKAQLD